MPAAHNSFCKQGSKPLKSNNSQKGNVFCFYFSLNNIGPTLKIEPHVPENISETKNQNTHFCFKLQQTGFGMVWKSEIITLTICMYLVKISSNVDIVILSYIHIFYMFIKFYLIQIQIDVTLQRAVISI